MLIKESILRKKIREIILEQNNTKCLTSGAMFHTSIEPEKVGIEVDIPFELDIDKKESEILETLLHNVVELVLRPYFSDSKKDEKILIDNPPSEEERVKELDIIRNQYENKFNDESLLYSLDSEICELFDNIIIDSGFDSCINLIDEIKDKISSTIYYHKEHFDCLRPKELAEKYDIVFHSDDLESAKTSAYPSGHATQGYYIAYNLSDTFPSLREEFLNLANMIAQSRLDRGVHFPSDIEGGKALAKEFHNSSKD
tara:strand:- start:270 stop:1037 length:768 start_codon:yes stop_codon:yes gene_type:complete